MFPDFGADAVRPKSAAVVQRFMVLTVSCRPIAADHLRQLAMPFTRNRSPIARRTGHSRSPYGSLSRALRMDNKFHYRSTAIDERWRFYRVAVSESDGSR
jgi:hypothetical protein